MTPNTRLLQCPECRNNITLLVSNDPNEGKRGCTVCGACGAFVAFEGATARLMTDDEILSLPDDLRIEMTAMRRHINKHGKVTGPQLSDDRLAAIIDGAKLEPHESRIIAAELLARRAKDLGPINCPNCESPNVAITIVDDHFNYGTPPNTVLLTARDVEILKCTDCSQMFSGYQGEQKRAQAVVEHLATKMREVQA